MSFFDKLILVIFFIFLFFLGLIFFLIAIKVLKRISYLLFTKKVEIKDLQEGRFLIRGRVINASNILYSPLTNQPCVGYVFIISEMRRVPSSRGGSEIRDYDLDVFKSSVPFFIYDFTGRVYVNLSPDNFYFKRLKIKLSPTYSKNPLSDGIQLIEKNIISTDDLKEYKYKYSEGVIPVNSEVCLIGYFKREGKYYSVVNQNDGKTYVFPGTFKEWIFIDLLFFIFISVLSLIFFGGAILVLISLFVVSLF